MKPEWLKRIEHHRNLLKREPDMCTECIYLGDPVKNTRHHGGEKVIVYECDIHPGCLNTKYSICCADFTPSELV